MFAFLLLLALAALLFGLFTTLKWLIIVAIAFAVGSFVVGMIERGGRNRL